jgi:hypothetical protein
MTGEGWFIGDRIKVYFDKLNVNFSIDDILDTESAENLLLLVGLADCNISHKGFCLYVDSDIEALYFENIKCQPGFELYAITAVEESRYGAGHEMHYFGMYSCPTAQNNYVAHYEVAELDKLIDKLLEYTADVLGDDYIEYIPGYITLGCPRYVIRNAEIIDQLKAIAISETVRDRMPEFAEALLSKLSELALSKLEDEDC